MGASRGSCGLQNSRRRRRPLQRASESLPLTIQPSVNLRRIGDTFDDGRLSITRDQHSPGDFALPAWVDFEAHALGKRIVENPVLRARETGPCEHLGSIFHLVWN